MAAVAPVCAFGLPAPDFALPDVAGRRWTRDAARGPKGLLVAFICNHCPYVKAIAGRFADDAAALRRLGVGVVAINANDPTDRPEDAPERMASFAAAHGFGFPYLFDATQAVARAYGAVCTPDFFGYDAGLTLQYRGRFDASGRQAAAGSRRELFEAMAQVAATGRGPAEQTAAIGCSIKWRAA